MDFPVPARTEQPRPDARALGLWAHAAFLRSGTGGASSKDVPDAGLAKAWWQISLRAPFRADGHGHSWSVETRQSGASGKG